MYEKKRGRPRKPTALKVLQGTEKPCRRLDGDEVEPTGELGSPPPELSVAEAAEWVRVAAVCPWLTVADRDCLRQYCFWVLRVNDAIENDDVDLAAKCCREWRYLADRIGLHPSARSSIRTVAKKTETVEDFAASREIG